jgi:hypothetical protein
MNEQEQVEKVVQVCQTWVLGPRQKSGALVTTVLTDQGRIYEQWLSNESDSKGWTQVTVDIEGAGVA